MDSSHKTETKVTYVWDLSWEKCFDLPFLEKGTVSALPETIVCDTS